jgi:hypothetical protein
MMQVLATAFVRAVRELCGFRYITARSRMGAADYVYSMSYDISSCDCPVVLLQISVYGMNERIGLVSFPPRQEAFDKPYSQETAHMIDQEVRSWLVG